MLLRLTGDRQHVIHLENMLLPFHNFTTCVSQLMYNMIGAMTVNSHPNSNEKTDEETRGDMMEMTWITHNRQFL